MNRGTWGVLVAVPAAATLVCFSPALENGFVWDDGANIVQNPHLERLDGALVVWSFTDFRLGHYQPFTWISLALDRAIWGLRASGFHLTSLLLHAFNAVLFASSRAGCSRRRCGRGTVRRPKEIRRRRTAGARSRSTSRAGRGRRLRSAPDAGRVGRLGDRAARPPRRALRLRVAPRLSPYGRARRRRRPPGGLGALALRSLRRLPLLEGARARTAVRPAGARLLSAAPSRRRCREAERRRARGREDPVPSSCRSRSVRARSPPSRTPAR
ncbi:MAG: hypothetical protein R2862_07680 [Thermoanaerobaculia bacterium]